MLLFPWSVSCGSNEILNLYLCLLLFAIPELPRTIAASRVISVGLWCVGIVKWTGEGGGAAEVARVRACTLPVNQYRCGTLATTDPSLNERDILTTLEIYTGSPMVWFCDLLGEPWMTFSVTTAATHGQPRGLERRNTMGKHYMICLQIFVCFNNTELKCVGLLWILNL